MRQYFILQKNDFNVFYYVQVFVFIWSKIFCQEGSIREIIYLVRPYEYVKINEIDKVSLFLT